VVIDILFGSITDLPIGISPPAWKQLLVAKLDRPSLGHRKELILGTGKI
jgi:hypothetical protein